MGKVGGLALGYFLVMSTFALTIGLIVGNLIKPGEGLELSDALASEGASGGGGQRRHRRLRARHHPRLAVLLADLRRVLQTLFVALLVGFALQAMGRAGEPILLGVGYLQRLVFRVLAMIMWAGPVGAFGAMAAVVGETGAGGA